MSSRVLRALLLVGAGALCVGLLLSLNMFGSMTLLTAFEASIVLGFAYSLLLILTGDWLSRLAAGAWCVWGLAVTLSPWVLGLMSDKNNMVQFALALYIFGPILTVALVVRGVRTAARYKSPHAAPNKGIEQDARR